MKLQLINRNRLPLGFSTLVLALAAPFASAVTETFNTVGTTNWVCPEGVTSLQVECWGGGGAGGAGRKDTTSGTNTSQNGAGGGGGAYAKRAFVPVTPGQTYVITIPAAAVSGTNGTTTNNGGAVAGGNVQFVGDSGVTVKAAGGSGGPNAYTTANSTTGTSSGGAGGTVGNSIGDAGAVFAGGSGFRGTLGAVSGQDNSSGGGGGGAGNAAAGSTAVTGGTGAAGGSVGGGAGGNGRIGANTNFGVGSPGLNPGGGGGGGKNGGISTRLGGNGGLGQMILTYTDNAKDNDVDNLNLASSWIGGFVPTTDHAGVWDDRVAGANTTVLGANLTFGGIRISDPGGLVTVDADGNTLTLGARAIDIDMTSATQDLILNCALSMDAANVWDVAATRTVTLGGVVSGANPVTKQGTGSAVLSGANTYTGNSSLNAGTVLLNSAESENVSGPLGQQLASAAGTIVLGGATLQYSGSNNFDYSGRFSTAANQKYNVDTNGQSVTWGAALTSSGGILTKTGTGTLVLSGANTYSGATTISGGSVQSGASEVIPNGTGNGNVTVNGTLDLNTFSETINGLSGAGTVDSVGGGAPILTVGDNNQSSTFSGTITDTSGTLGLTKTGTGTLTLSGPLSYAGPTLVSGGKLVVPSTHTGTGAATLSASTILGVTASSTSQWQPASLLLPDPSTLEFRSVQNPNTTTAPLLPTAAVGTVSGVTVNVTSVAGSTAINDSFPLLGNQDGTTNGYTLGAQPVGFTGSLSASGSTLSYVLTSVSSIWTGADGTNPTFWDVASTPNWTAKGLTNLPAGSYADGDSVVFDDSAAPASLVTVAPQAPVAPGNMFFANSSKNYIVNTAGANVIGGGGSLTKSGTGTLTLAGPNNYSGGTTIAGGIIVANDSGALGGGNVTINGTRLSAAGGTTVANDIIIGVNTGASGRGLVESSGTGTATLSGDITINNGAAAGGHFASTTDNDLLLSGVITSTPTVAQRTGTVTYSGGGTGYTNISVTGTARVGALNGLATTATAAIGVSAAGTLDLNGFNQTLVGITKGGSAATIGNRSTDADSLLTTTGTSTFAGVIKDVLGSGDQKVALAVDSGILTLTGTNTFTGDIAVNGGKLSGGAAGFGASSNARTITVANGATLEFGAGNVFGNHATINVPGIVVNGGTITNADLANSVAPNRKVNNALNNVTLNSGTLTATKGNEDSTDIRPGEGYGAWGLNGTVTSSGTSLIDTTAVLGKAGHVLLSSTTSNTVFDVTSGTLTIASILQRGDSASDNGLTKTGLGALVFGAANIYTGTTVIDQGTLDFSTVDQTLGGGLTFGATAGSPNNGVLDLSTASATFTGATLVRTNSATANTITIGAGETLTLNGGLTIGYDSGSLPATASKLTVNGGGSLAVTGTTITIGQGLAANNQAWYNTGTLDVTSLASFSANVTNFNLGVGVTNGTGSNGIVLLSNTANTLIATTLKVGDTLGENGGQSNTTLTLGTGTNVIQADTIEIGKGKPSGPNGYRVRFASQTAGSPGTVTIANKAGSGAATINVANMGSTGTGGNVVASLDLRGHDSTVNASTLLIANSTNGTGSNVSGSNGTVHFDTGTFTVGTLNMGLKSGNSTGTAVGTLNVGGGSFTVNTAFTLGSHSGAGASTATLNITGGTFTSNADIATGAGTVTSNLNINGATAILDMSGDDITNVDNITFTDGTLKDLGIVNTGMTLAGTGSRVFDQGVAGEVQGEIAGAGIGLTKQGAGTLTLKGANSYSGDTSVSAGTLELADNAQLKFVLGAASGLNNSISGAGTVTLNGDFNIDTTAADGLSSGTWVLENVASLGGAYGVDFTVAGFSDITGEKWEKALSPFKKYTFDETTGTLTLSSGTTYASWIGGFGLIGIEALSGSDPDFDTIPNAVEMVLGGNPATVMDLALLPTLELVTDPMGSPAIPAGDYFLFTFRRSDLSVSAGLTSVGETDADLVGPWTPAVDMVSGAIIQVDDDFAWTNPAAASTDRVRVYVPRGANLTLFGRLNVVVP